MNIVFKNIIKWNKIKLIILTKRGGISENQFNEQPF